MIARKRKAKLLNTPRMAAHEDQIAVSDPFDPIMGSLERDQRQVVHNGLTHVVDIRTTQIVGSVADRSSIDHKNLQADLFFDTLEETRDLLEETKEM